jgi:large repetitive protein
VGGMVVVDHRVETFAGEAVLVEVIDAAAPAGVRVEAFRSASHGTVALLPGAPDGGRGVFRYVPQGGFVGVDAFGYRLSGDDPAVLRWVEIRVRAVNGAPIAVGEVVLVEGDGPVTFAVLANDRDPDGDDLRITGFTMPAKGQLVLEAGASPGSGGVFTYWPGPAFLMHDELGGHDSFTYTIRDIREPGDGQVGTAEAQVTLLRPVVVPAPNVSPIAMRDAVVTARDTTVSISVLANDVDPDGDPLRVVGLTVPLFGSVVLEADQSVTYTPAPGFTGIDDFTYVVEDGRGGRATGAVMIEVTA